MKLSLFHRLLLRAVHGVYRLLGGLRGEGLENIPEHGPAIIAPNHHSWADPPALRILIRRRCGFMANDFLFNVPVLGKLLPHYGAFPVTRGKLDREAIRRAEEHLKDGDLVLIFPEGGTTITGTLFPFEGGVALLAIRNNVPVVPVGITGTDKLLNMHKPVPRYVPGGVKVRFGRPIHPSEIDPALPRRERVDLLTQRLYQAVADLLPPEYVPEEYHRERKMPAPPAPTMTTAAEQST
jgi:1-acyl-sn-glycerol-3-phosphate acyltransferase